MNEGPCFSSSLSAFGIVSVLDLGYSNAWIVVPHNCLNLWFPNDIRYWSRDITLPTKVHLGKAMVFPVVMYGCESWNVKKAERRRIDAFELWCWRRLLRVPWTARKSNQSILKEISPGCSLEELMLMLKLQYFGHLMWRVDSLEKTDPGRDWGQEEKWTTEDKMAGWHHQLDGHEFGWTPGVGDGQGGLLLLLLLSHFSRVWLFATPWIVEHQASLSITNSWNLPKLMSL